MVEIERHVVIPLIYRHIVLALVLQVATTSIESLFSYEYKD
jgi:hypothetical protein